MDFKNSETAHNLMRAFAGESQARNRYTMAASQAKTQNLHVLEAVFLFTADQEKEHAEIFWKFLAPLSGGKLEADGTYPVDQSDSINALLHAAQRNEEEEHDTVYRLFGERAQEEGYPAIAAAFRNIAAIEKTHAERFRQFAELLDAGKLFVSEVACDWMCLNCGHRMNGKQAPAKCPVCDHDQGYFIRLTMAPYTTV